MRIGVLYAHPIRMRINTVLYRREMSPTQWLEEFGGGSYGKVLGHFKALEKIGWLRKVRSRKDVAGRGRTRDLYRATELPVIDDETWAELPLSIQVAFTARCMRHLGERIGDAFARGAVDARGNSDRLFSCRSVRLDDLGWESAMAILREGFFSLAQEQLDAKVRLDDSPDPGRLMTIALAGFESPCPGKAPRPGTAGSEEHFPLRLGDSGDLPLSTRMAKVFGDPLMLQILKELQFRDMSPSQLKAKVGGASPQAFDRRCKTLTELGWLVRLGRGADSPLVLYRAAGPEAFDADLWGGIPVAAKQAPSWPVFDEFCQKAEEALRQGSFNARPNRHVTWCTFLLDERGWLQVTHALKRCNDQLNAVAAGAKKRALAASRSTPPFLATFLLASFEDPQGDSECWEGSQSEG